MKRKSSKKVLFSELKPGQQFSEKRGGSLNIRIQGFGVTCVPGEEYGNDPYNAISLIDGSPKTFDVETAVFKK